MIKILIADDHAVVRQGIKNIVESGNDMQVIGEASNGAELLNFVKSQMPDVVILDLSMPGRNGLEILKDIKRQFPSLSVIILSMHPEDQYAVRAFRAGASGYMTKESAPSELVKAIKIANQGGKYISPLAAALLASYVEIKSVDEQHKLLSDREYEVFILLAEGQTVGEIAVGLNLSVKTISTYRTRILEKMRMTTNAELARYARNFNLI
ncbi:MAG: response regulator transcription factor [Pyrinomonadaceae bacterium]|nr:response regulator transcription factor [Pyrinomonadaceae bacterium]